MPVQDGNVIETETKTEAEDVRFPGWPFVGGGSQGDDDGGSADAGGDLGGGGSDDGGGDGDPDSPIDVRDIASEIDAQALAELEAAGDDDDPNADDDAAGEGKGKGKVAPRRAPAAIDPALQDFINKNYNGNVTAFLAAQHTSREEGKRLADKVKELEGQLSGRANNRDTAAELKAVIESDEDVRALDQRITSTIENLKTLYARQDNLSKQSVTLNEKITTMTAQLPYIDDPKESSKMSAALTDARTQLAIIIGEFESNETKREMREDRLDTLRRDRAKLERQLKADLDAEENEKAEQADRDRRTVAIFNGAVDSILEPYGIDAKSEHMTLIREHLRTGVADWLESLGPKARSVDAAGIYSAVSSLFKVYARVHQMRPKAAGAPKPGPRPPLQPSSRRPNLPAPVAGKGGRSNTPVAPAPPRSARSMDDIFSDPDKIRKRAAAIDKAIERRSASGDQGPLA